MSVLSSRRHLTQLGTSALAIECGEVRNAFQQFIKAKDTALQTLRKEAKMVLKMSIVLRLRNCRLTKRIE
jgi:hypothetical protein